jgi:inner membrane protease ATP23
MSDLSSTSEAGPSTLPSGFEKWRTSLSQFTGLGLTDDQKAERESMKENQTLAKDWDRCEKWKKDLLEGSKSTSTPVISGAR